MLRALNDDSSEDGSRSIAVVKATTKEAQESEVLSLYNQALSQERHGEKAEAKETYLAILSQPLIQKIGCTEDSEDEGFQSDTGGLRSLQVLKYSTYKNLAAMCYDTEDWDQAIQFYLEAVLVDGTDVTVWYKIGTLALKIHNYALARHSFEQGLLCNPRHWPCLDNVITIMYALQNYDMCLYYISRALCRDPGYVKGLVFMQHMYEEQPSLQRDTMHLFHECDPSIYDASVDEEETQEYIGEALRIREKRREMCQPEKRPVLEFIRPLTRNTWQDVGECLVSLYEHVTSVMNTQNKKGISLSCKVNVSGYLASQSPVRSSPSAMAAMQAIVAMAAYNAPVLHLAVPSSSPGCSEFGNLQATLLDLASSSTDAGAGISLLTQHSPTLNLPITAGILSGMISGPAGPTLTGGKPLLGGTPEAFGLGAPTGSAGQDSQFNMDTDTPAADSVSVNLFGEDPLGKRKQQGTKRKQLWAMQEEWGGKRRSTRVRNVVHRKQEESINYQQLLSKFLPHSLRYGRPYQKPEEVPSQEEEAMDTGVTINSNAAATTTQHMCNTSPKSALSSLTNTEMSDVLAFLNKHEHNGGVLCLMRAYLIKLSQLALHKWPKGLTDVYIQVYDRYRKHMEYPEYLCRDVSDSVIKTLAELCLCVMELKVDKWRSVKSRMNTSLSSSPRKSPVRSILGPDYPGLYFTGDLDYLLELACLKDILKDDWSTFNARLCWLSGKYMLLENRLDGALDYFEQIGAFMSDSTITISLPNIIHDSVISTSSVSQQVESLQRCQSLEEVHRLHDAGDHQRVVTLLLQTFTHKGGSNKLQGEVTDRMEQLVLLQESLLKLEEYKKCALWSEVCLHEALKCYHNSSSKTARIDWLSTATTLMEGLENVFVIDTSVIDTLPSSNLTRLTQSLLWLLDLTLDVPETSVEMVISTPLPWILLYRLISNEEKIYPRRNENEDEDDDDDELPASIMLLNFAHQYLGRRSWCVYNDGRLLLFTAAEFTRLLQDDGNKTDTTTDSPHPFKEDLEEAIEQCYYCLYAHPNKRTKAKHLQDHGVPQIELTWDRAAGVFDYFKPKTMPEYDSYRTSTVSAELENLLKRVVLLIPPNVGLTGNTIESITSFIEGTSSQPPSVSNGNSTPMPIVSEIYYLMGDYYFKNKESAKAIKFYLHDLCVNPERFDSWAGMALARSSRLEQRLNSHELKNEPTKIQKQASSALRCFRQALQIDSYNHKLWIEYGNLAYQLHSYLSRTLKQLSLFPLTEDVLELTRKNKAEMLRVACDCYTRAGSCDEEGLEEPWFQHYMLGKIAEKMGEEPAVFLRHYKQAASYLHEERAKYPKKIMYILSPPFLSVEALEVFYRLHVSVIKYLIRNEAHINHLTGLTGTSTSDSKDIPEIPASDEEVKNKLHLSVLDKFVSESLKGRFARAQEKEKPKVKITNEKGDSGDAATGNNPTSSSAVPTTDKVRTPTRASRLDHTYSSMSHRHRQHHNPYQHQLSDHSQDTPQSTSSLTSPLYFLSNMSPVPPRRSNNPPLLRSRSTGSSADMFHRGLLPLTSPFSTSSFSPPGVPSPMLPPISSTAAYLQSAISSGYAQSAAAAAATAAYIAESIAISSISNMVAMAAAQNAFLSNPSAFTCPSAGILESSSIMGAEHIRRAMAVQGLLSTSCTSATSLMDSTISSLVSTPMGSTPRVGGDISINTPAVMRRLSSELPPGITPLAVTSTSTAMSLSHASVSLTNSTTSVVTTGIPRTTLAAMTTTTASTVSPVMSSVVDSTTCGRSRNSLSFSMDSILGISDHESPVKKENIPRTEKKSISEKSCVSEGSGKIGGDDINRRTVDVEMTYREMELADVEDITMIKEKPSSDNASYGNCETITEVAKIKDENISKDVEKVDAIDREDCKEVISEVKVAVTNLLKDVVTKIIESHDEKGKDDEDIKINQKKPDMNIITERKENDADLSVQIEVGNSDEGSTMISEITDKTDTAATSVNIIGSTVSDAKNMVISLPQTITKEEPNKTPPRCISNTSEGDTSPPILKSPIKNELLSSPVPSVGCTPIIRSMSESSVVKSEATMPELEAEMPVLEKVQMAGGEGEKGEVIGQEENKEGGCEKEKHSDDKSAEETGSDLNKKAKDSKDDTCAEREEEMDIDEEKKGLNAVSYYTHVLREAMKGLELCLGRFPQHYKSLYRLAQVYHITHIEELKDSAKSRDLLLGNTGWQDLSHMPCQGLFQERKGTNFFMGLWRIPVEDIDRSGSFASHIAKALWLSFDILEKLHDYKGLYQVYVGLNKTPEQGKKYLRDSERMLLAKRAFIMCFDIVEQKTPEMEEKDGEVKKAFLLEIHRYWQHGVRHQIDVKRINNIFTDVYRVCRKSLEPNPVCTLENAMKYCTQLTAKPQVPKENVSAKTESKTPLLTPITTNSGAGTSWMEERIPDPDKITLDMKALFKQPMISATSSPITPSTKPPPPSFKNETSTSGNTASATSTGSGNKGAGEEETDENVVMASNRDIMSMFNLTPTELEEFLQEEEEQGMDTDMPAEDELDIIVIDENNIEVKISPKKTVKPDNQESAKKEKTPSIQETIGKTESSIIEPKIEENMVLSEKTGKLVPESAVASKPDSKTISDGKHGMATVGKHLPEDDSAKTESKSTSELKDLNRQDSIKTNDSNDQAGLNLSIEVIFDETTGEFVPDPASSLKYEDLPPVVSKDDGIEIVAQIQGTSTAISTKSRGGVSVPYKGAVKPITSSGGSSAVSRVKLSEGKGKGKWGDGLEKSSDDNLHSTSQSDSSISSDDDDSDVIVLSSSD